MTRPHRASRRRRESRARLLRAALQLMAHRTPDGVAINEITDAADMGFGTFYNYFESKEAIYEALVNEVFEDFGAALDLIAEQIDDPVEIFAASVRYTLRRTAEEPVWGRFLVSTGFFWPHALERGLGPRMLRDLEAAAAAGHFENQDLSMTVVAVRGAVLSAVDVNARVASSAAVSDRGFANVLEANHETLPERAAAVILRLIGYEPEEAEEIACRPLPGVDLPPNPLQPLS